MMLASDVDDEVKLVVIEEGGPHLSTPWRMKNVYIYRMKNRRILTFEIIAKYIFFHLYYSSIPIGQSILHRIHQLIGIDPSDHWHDAVSLIA